MIASYNYAYKITHASHASCFTDDEMLALSLVATHNVGIVYTPYYRLAVARSGYCI